MIRKIMILRISKHELTRYYRDGRSITLMSTVILMLIGSMFLSFRDYKLAQIQYQENLVQARLNWENQAEKNPHDAAHDGTYVIKPYHPLALLDEGLQNYSGRVIHLGAHERKQSSLNEVKNHSEIFRFGQLTPLFILSYVLPLLLIFLGYNSFTEEKERKTIRLLLAQGASTTQLAMGKFLALMFQMVVLSLIFLVATLICYSFLNKEIGVSIIECLVFASIYLIYFFVFSNLVLIISAISRTSGISLTISLTLWIVITLIIPKTSTNLASSLYPFPTLQSFRNNINEDQKNGLNGHNFWNESAMDFKEQVLKKYDVETIEDLPIAYGGLLLAEGEKYESEIYTKHFNLLRDQYSKQRKVYRTGGVLSPFLPLRFMSMALARTDYGFQWHYEDEAEKYRVAFNTALNMNIAENAKGVENYKAGDKLWSSIPSFKYKWQSAKDILRDHVVELSSILVWATFSFLLMLAISARIKVI